MVLFLQVAPGGEAVEMTVDVVAGMTDAEALAWAVEGAAAMAWATAREAQVGTLADVRTMAAATAADHPSLSRTMGLSSRACPAC